MTFPYLVSYTTDMKNQASCWFLGKHQCFRVVRSCCRCGEWDKPPWKAASSALVLLNSLVVVGAGYSDLQLHLSPLLPCSTSFSSIFYLLV